MQDVTKDVQAQFDKGIYSLDGFDGAAISYVVLKHPEARITASSPVTVSMLPTFWQDNPSLGKSKSVPMFGTDSKLGSPNYFEHISFSRQIKINGGFPNLLPMDVLNDAVSHPLGLCRNVFDQVIRSSQDHIAEFHWDAGSFNCANTVVSLSSVSKAEIRGAFSKIAGKVCGVSYGINDYPMFIDLSPRYVDYVNSTMDFSSPGPLKSARKKHIPMGYAHDFVATNVFGRSKTAAYWNVTLEGISLNSLSWPSPVAWSGFTVTEPLQYCVVKNCHFRDFLRAGLELRSPGGTCRVYDIRTENSLNAVLLNGSQAKTEVAGTIADNCKSDGDGNLDYWQTVVAEAKAEALKYGQIINFPV